MSSARLTHRAVAVSTGALALCLFSAGVASADPLPLPPLPSPDNVITTLDQTVTQVTTTQPGSTTPGSTTPGSTTPTGTTPTTTTTSTTSTPTTTAKKPAAGGTVIRTAPHRAPATRPAVTVAAADTPTYTAMMPAPMAGDMALPPSTAVPAAAAQPPAVAPLLMPQSVQHITPSAAVADLDKHSGSPLRGILLTLAVAAAVGVGYEHWRLVHA